MFNKAFQRFIEIPYQFRLFLFKALMVFLSWSFLYNGYLKPHHLLDPFITSIVAKLTAFVLSLIYYGQPVVTVIRFGSPIIRISGVGTLTILDGCNGLELLAVYAGFILCLPSNTKSTLKYLISGIACIFALNIARCIVLAALQHAHFQSIDTVHHYIFTLVVYSFIFFLWVYYLKSTNILRQT